MVKLRELLSNYPFLTNRAFWLGISSVLYLVLSSFGLIDMPEEQWVQIVEKVLIAVAGVLTALGLSHDLSKGKWFKDE